MYIFWAVLMEFDAGESLSIQPFAEVFYGNLDQLELIARVTLGNRLDQEVLYNQGNELAAMCTTIFNIVAFVLVYSYDSCFRLDLGASGVYVSVTFIVDNKWSNMSVNVMP
jgi:hypothetical protein